MYGLKKLSDNTNLISNGTEFFTDQKVGGKDCDIFMVKDENALTTLLYIKDFDNRERREVLDQCGLTEREIEIAECVIRGWHSFIPWGI